MTPNEIGQILKELGVIRGDLSTLRVEVKEARTDIAEVKADGKETKSEVKLTNGRVTAIEQRHASEDAVAQDHIESRQRWNGWFSPIVTGVSTGTIMLVITLLATGKF